MQSMDNSDVDVNDPLLLKSKKRKVKDGEGTSTKKKAKLSSRAQVSRVVQSENRRSPEVEARSYQTEVLDKALKENIIAYLETGSGKTFIAVLLLRKLADRLRMPKEKRIAVFLAPTVHLVIQQADVISSNTDLHVGLYHGKHQIDIDTWSSDRWHEEVNLHEVLVMTPQVFYNALESSALSMEIVEVLIVDECHHAQKNHQYASIMKTYYHSSTLKVKPKVFGMTASLVNTRGSACSQQITDLECILDSKVYTLVDRAELEAKAPTPNHRSRFYNKPYHNFDNVRAHLSQLRDQYTKGQNIFTGEFQFSDEKELKERILKSIQGLYSGIDYCLLELGLWGACLAVDIYSKQHEIDLPPECSIEDKELLEENHRNRFLQEVSKLLSSAMPEGSINSCDSEKQVKLAVKKGLITPKVQVLVAVLMRYRSVENIRCIVFVERVVVSMVLSTLLKHFLCLEFLRVDHLAGVNSELCFKTTNKQQQKVKSFRDGELNLLIATSVAEEGLDVQKCNSVVRFDLCNTLRSYIQSRGRARTPGADYVWLLERGNLAHEQLLLEMIKSEILMREQALSRINMVVERKPPVDKDLEILQLDSGACISTAGTISFIYRYCAKLPRDRYYNPRPDFLFKRGDELYTCVIMFPPNAPIHSLEGPPRRTKQLSKKIACLEACKRLYAIGALTKDSLRALHRIDEEDGMAPKDPSGSGTTKLKELYPSGKSTTLQQGTWLSSSKGAHFHVYALTFSLEPSEPEAYTNFAFLVEEALDNDVGNFGVDLYATKSRVVKAQLSTIGQRWLDAKKLAAAKAYQEIMFNGAFSRLVFYDEEDRNIAKCLLTYEERAKDLWTHTYLLLPFISNSTLIDWKSITVTGDAAKVLPHLCLVPARDKEEKEAEVCLEGGDMVRTAGGPVHVSMLQDCIVLTIHSGKLFFITEILYSLNAGSTFQENKGSEPCTYSEFYMRKHGRLLLFRNQPLLRAKPTHAPHNHLLKPNVTEDRAGKPMVNAVGKFVELPPELCLVLGSKSSFIRSLYLVPSYMHRLTSLIIASELRAKFTKHAPSAHAFKILEALTSTRCQEEFSYEGLELLGDSVLKYAVSQKLFLVYTSKHEGQLSGRRSRAICNATLHRLAIAKDLPAYIRDEPFYPSLWVGAGMYPLKRRKCLCNLSKLVTESSSQPKPTKHTFFIGKTCGEGHRWMCSKTTADVVEALIGAYAVGGGLHGAFEFMKAINIDIDFDGCLIESARQCCSVPRETVKYCLSRLESLEKQLSYSFQNKALLLEAVTHASKPDSGFCYQRLEFLGDAALDLLITQDLFKTHPGLTPGLLSDLRSAAVNNDCFARVAVKHNLHCYLRHDSGELQAQVTTFVKALSVDSHEQDGMFGFKALSGPKVLGDLVESITGAVLVDTSFDLKKVWAVMKPLLSPLVTPATLLLHPIRELQELCSLKNFQRKWITLAHEKMTTAKLTVQVGEETFVQSSQMKQKKAAKKDAATKMLITLKEHGHMHPRCESAEQVTVMDTFQVPTSSFLELDFNQGCISPRLSKCDDSDVMTFPGSDCKKDVEVLVKTEAEDVTQLNQDCTPKVAPDGNPLNQGEEIKSTRKPEDTSLGHFEKIPAMENSTIISAASHAFIPKTDANSPKLPTPFKQGCASLKMENPGCARAYLHELCKQRMWARPKFEETEKCGFAHRRWFTCTLSIEIPERGSFEQVSCPMTNKKRAMEDAAKKMLLQLKSLDIIT